MSQDFWNFLFIGASFALYIGIAIKSRAGTTKEYYVASGGVSPFANGMATAADWIRRRHSFRWLAVSLRAAMTRRDFSWDGRAASYC